MRARGADLREFLEHAGDHPLDEYEDHALDFLNHIREEKAASTVRRYLGTLRVFGRWCGLRDPLADYLAPTPAKPQPHPLPEGLDGVTAMLNLARSHNHKNLVALTGLVGLRVGEAVTVTTDDVDTIERTIYVRGKGDRARIVPLSDRVLRVLAHRLRHPNPDGRLVPLHERTARKVITRLGGRAGLARTVASHDMRATFATEAYRKSKDLRAVQELVGHADSRTTEVYTQVTMDSMRSALPGDEQEDVA